MDAIIRLLSPTLIGNGEGWGSIIDLDVIYDNVGLPFIPARRIKGILRESSLEVIEMFYLSGLNVFSRGDIDAIFGKPGVKAGECIIGNFRLRGYEDYRKWVLWGLDNYPEIFSRDRIENLFTVFRSQTAIDETGVTEENSLRSERALKRGLEFAGEITLQPNDENYNRHLCLLVISMKNTRRMGTNRNRGFGKIKFDIPEEFENKAKSFLEEKGVKIGK